ncbi:MAG: Uma2 family endonuclease [Dehalococcoidia bacterium]|nr:Uma2 family endonuclease [Dehalococcoidia bacterium]
MVTLNIKKREDTRPPVPNDGVHYPESDGEPVAESDFQYVPLTYATSALSAHFSEEPDIYVTGDMLIYFVEGDPRRSVAPDVFLIPNLDKRFRTSYFMWLEGQVPSFIMEVTSNSTWREDIGRKRDLYESWGVSEYWLYDPTEETRLTTLLQGFRLVDDAYEPIEIEFDGESYRGFSSALGLELHARKDWFSFFNPATGEYLKNLEESERARVSERRARENEQTARLTAERERDEERARREDLERVLREHGIEPPS